MGVTLHAWKYDTATILRSFSMPVRESARWPWRWLGNLEAGVATSMCF